MRCSQLCDPEKRDNMLDAFLQRVSEKDCPNCPRMKDCQPVLRMKESDLNKPIMFIAEAPDRLGAEISRIPLYGDQTGDNFEELHPKKLKSGIVRVFFLIK
jgi:uracil-DNA glycosylase